MDVLGDLLARERRSASPALRVASRERAYSYRDFCTTAYKAGNFLRYLGVNRGRRVDVEPDPAAPPLLTFAGAALLGAVTRFDTRTGDAGRAVVVPRSREGAVDLPPGSKLAVYGGPPSSASTAHWEESVWSENPAFPPTGIEADDPALAVADAAYSHRELLDAASALAPRVDADATVAVRSALSDPRTVVAGVVAPLLVGGCVLLPDGEATADVAVTDAGDVPEPETIPLSDVPL